MEIRNYIQEDVVGFIGLGSLGEPIAKRLEVKNVNLRIFNRGKRALKSIKLNKIKRYDQLKCLLKECKFIFLCVSDEQAVKDILFEQGKIKQSIKRGATILDLSTISPSTTRFIAQKAEEVKINYIDCPVSGGTEGARKGKLTMFFGGSEEEALPLKELLNIFTDTIYTFDDRGKGQEVKALNQILVAGSYIAVAEAVSLAQRLNLPMNKVINALNKGAASSWALSNRSSFMINDEYPLGFRLDLHKKDLEIALSIAKEVDLILPIASLVKNIEEDLIAKGWAEKDVSVLKKAIQ